MPTFRPGGPARWSAPGSARVAAAACFLPLSVNPRVSRDLGTRHRAALGLTEENDAIAIVVGRHLRTHGKPLVLLNVAGFYDPLLEMIRRGIDSGFIRPAAWEPVRVAGSVEVEASMAIASAAIPKSLLEDFM